MISQLKIELQIDDGVHIEDDMGWYPNPVFLFIGIQIPTVHNPFGPKGNPYSHN